MAVTHSRGFVVRKSVLAIGFVVGTVGLSSFGVANADGGTRPSNAPLITLGQTYFGNVANDDPMNRNGDVWRLPPLLEQDAVTVSGVRTDTQGIQDLVYVCLNGNVDDFDFQDEFCGLAVGGPSYIDRSGSRVTLQANAAASDAFLEFSDSFALATYQFTVETIQHKVGLSLTALTSVKRKGRVAGSAVLTNSAPVPDGTTISLIVTKGSARWVYTAPAAGGRLSFKMALPKSLTGKKVKLRLYRSATTTIQAGSSSAIKARIR